MRAVTTLLCILTVSACLLPEVVRAQSDDVPEHYSGSLGFHNTTAPLGGRYWFGGQKVGLDFGLGFSSEPAPLDSDESLKSWAIEAGVPFVLKNWDKVHLLGRPGVMFESQEVQTSGPTEPFDTDSETNLSVTFEIEAEIFIVNNFSVSASEGIGFFQFSPAGDGDSTTSFGTLGNNFSHIGFHVYFFGPKG